MIKIYRHKGKPKDKLWIRVSKKVSKRAVDRNRLRRQVKNAVRELTDRDMSAWIISVLPEALGQPYSVLKREISKRLPR